MSPITVLRDTQPIPLLDACKWTRIAGEPHTVNLNAYTIGRWQQDHGHLDMHARQMAGGL